MFFGRSFAWLLQGGGAASRNPTTGFKVPSSRVSLNGNFSPGISAINCAPLRPVRAWPGCSYGNTAYSREPWGMLRISFCPFVLSEQVKKRKKKHIEIIKSWRISRAFLSWLQSGAMYFTGSVLHWTALVGVLACLLRWGEMVFPIFVSKAQQKMVCTGADALWGEHKAVLHVQFPWKVLPVNTRISMACWWDRFSVFICKAVCPRCLAHPYSTLARLLWSQSCISES